MENQMSSELTLSFLLMAVLCLEAVIIQRSIHLPAEKMTWTDARLYCQKNHIDLITWSTFGISWFTDFLVENKIERVWIGLHRDPGNVSVWKWINLKWASPLKWSLCWFQYILKCEWGKMQLLSKMSVICFRTGEGLSGDDVSQSSNWGNGQQSSQCAIVSDEDLLWYSDRCSGAHEFYCIMEDRIIHHGFNLSWYRASQYCQEYISDLATINKRNIGCFNKSGWIGLYREVGETWSWIGHGSSSYRNWAPGQPVNTDCGSFELASVEWQSHSCSKRLHFVCFDDNLVLVNESKTWEGALKHCRGMKTPCVDSLVPCEYRYNFMSLEDLSDYNYVRDRIYRATTDEVWEWVAGFTHYYYILLLFSRNAVLNRIKSLKRFHPHGAGPWLFKVKPPFVTGCMLQAVQPNSDVAFSHSFLEPNHRVVRRSYCNFNCFLRPAQIKLSSISQ